MADKHDTSTPTPKQKHDSDNESDIETPLRKKIQVDFDLITKENEDLTQNKGLDEDIAFIKNSLVNLTINFNLLNTNFDETKKSMENTLESVNNKATEALSSSKANNESIDNNSKFILRNTGDILNLMEENEILKEKLLKLDSNQRHKQLIFHGIQEANKEKGFDLYSKI